MSLPYLMEKLKSWAGRVGDPAFRPELGRRFVRNGAELLGLDKSTIPSTAWCAVRAVSLDEAYTRMGLEKAPFPPDVQMALREAEIRVQNHLQKRPIGPANLELLYTLCLHLKPDMVVETGVAHGWSSLIFLLALEGNGRLVSNDLPPTSSFNEDYIGIAVPEGLRVRWDLRRAADREGLAAIAAEGCRFQLAHYDSDKTYGGRIWGYNALWDMLEPGGILVSDDIGDNHAFADFCASKALEPVVIADPERGKYQGVLAKPVQ